MYFQYYSLFVYLMKSLISFFEKTIKVKIDQEVFEVGKEDLKVVRFPTVSTMHETSINDDSSGGEQGLSAELHFDSISLGPKVVSNGK